MSLKPFWKIQAATRHATGVAGHGGPQLISELQSGKKQNYFFFRGKILTEVDCKLNLRLFGRTSMMKGTFSGADLLELAVKIMKMNKPERKTLLSASKLFLDGAHGAGN